MTDQPKISLPILLLTVALIFAIMLGAVVAVQNRRYAEDNRRIQQARTVDSARFRSALDGFLRQMCVQDAEQGEVLAGILRQSPLRIDPAVRERYDAAISRLNELDDQCARQLPDRQAR